MRTRLVEYCDVWVVEVVQHDGAAGVTLPPRPPPQLELDAPGLLQMYACSQVGSIIGTHTPPRA
jgi:hypothetical protein